MNNFAISSGGIGEALKRSASSLDAANNTIDESIALITAANTVVQDPATVGTAFKTISMRIRGAKTELEEAGLETEGMVDSTAKLREEILALSGVDIMENANEFKSTYKIMDELAAKWENLSDIQQATITELIAGKRQGNVVSSLMSNFETARQVLDTSMNSAGSAMQEHEKWMQSVEASVNKVKAAWQSLSQSFLTSNFLKGFLSLVADLTEALSKLFDTFGALPAILGSIVAIKSLIAVITTLIGVGGGLKGLADIFALLSLAFPNVAKGIGIFTASVKTSGVVIGGFTGLLKGLWAVMVAHPILSIIAVVGLAITAFSKWGDSQEELSKKVDELTTKFQEQHKNLKKLQSDYDTTNESSMISKYERLSKGVDNLGRNVSLTSEEYSEYQSIVNSIADQIPSLISGYDEQGNALLSVKGNVEELVTAYEKLIHAQNQEILTNTKDIEDNFKNVSEDVGDIGFWEQIGRSTPIVKWFLDPEELPTDVVKKIEKGLENPDSLKYMDKWDSDSIKQALEKAGIEVGFFEDPVTVLKETIKTNPDKIKGIIDDHYAQFAEIVEQQKTIASAKLSEAFDVSSAISGLNYGNIDENLQEVARQTIGSLDFDFFSNLSEKGKTVEQWTKEMLDQLDAVGKVNGETIESAFELQTQFNNNDISYGEYVKNLQDVESIIDSLNLKSEAKKQLKISLDLDDDGVIDQYNALVKRLTDLENYDFDISESEAKKLLDGLSSEELAVAVDVIADLSNNNYAENAKEIKTAIERELTKQGLSLDLNIEVEKTKLEAVATAIKESFSGSGLSDESISAVEGMFSGLNGYDPSKLFERTANGISLNSEEYRKLNSQYKKTNIAKVNKQMDSLGDIYNQTREELYRLTYGTDEYNAKASELSGIEQQIKDLEQLEAGYRGVASAFQEWQMVESAGSQRDMYESLIKGLENIDDEISRGWYDDGTIEYLELLSGKDLSTAGIKEVKNAYKGLGKEIKHTTYSVRDFFTVDDEGNSTNKGVYNFLDAIGQLEEEAFGGKDVVQRKNGKIIGFDFQVVGGDEVIAEALGISEELVQIMVRAADDAGFVVSMDGTYQQLDVLKEKAQEAAEFLNQTLEKSGKKGFNFNFNTSNVDDIKKQLTEAQKILDTFRNTDGTVNTKIKGANEALTVASTLQSMLDKLTRPTYMDIQTNQVEDELQEPLKQLQELRRLTETEHQLKLSGSDTTKVKADIDELYTELDGLPDETKIEIGLVDEKKQPLTGDALKKKVNDIVSGEAELGITATIDIQLEMDEKLGILVDKALLDAGIIDKEEFQKRVNIYLDADVDSKDAESKTEQAVDNVVKNTKSDVKSAKAQVKSEVDNAKTEVKNAKNDIKSEVGGVKSEVESIKSEIANAKSDVEGLANALKSLQDMSEDTSVSVTAQLYGNVPKMDESKEIDDLVMFAEGAKALKDLPKDISVSVTANLEGNVPDMNEGEQIDDLLMFAAGVEALKDLPEEKSVSVTANLEGNVPDLNESEQIDDLLMFAAGAKALKDVGTERVILEVDAKISDSTKKIMDLNEGEQIDDLITFAKGAKAIKDLGLGENTKVAVEVDVKISDGTKDLMNMNEGEQIDDLITFAKGAAELKALGLGKDEQLSVNVDANLTGNVPDLNEGKQIDDLVTFAKGAADLKALGLKNEQLSVNIDANLTGNVPDLNESEQTDDLITFAKGAAELKALGLGNEQLSVNVDANLKGNVPDMNEGEQIDDLITFAKGAKELQGIESKNVTITAQLNGNVPNLNESEQIDDLITFSKGAKELQNLNSKEVVIKAQLNGNVPDLNEGEQIDDLITFAKGAKELQGVESKNVTITANANGNVIVGEGKESRLDSLSKFHNIAQKMTNQTVTVTVTAKVDSENVNKAIQLLKDVSSSGVFQDYKATVQVGAKVTTIDDTTVQNYKAPKKDGKVEYTVDSTKVDLWTAPPKDGVVNYSASVDALTDAQKHKTGTITYTPKIKGGLFGALFGGVAQGTAQANGTTGRAFARGNWGIKGSGVALGGELGREIVVRDGKFFTIGDEGAEFFRYKKNDIVFNAAQTEALFKYGGIKGANPRGKMLAAGTAFASGNAFPNGSTGSGGDTEIVVGKNSVTGEVYTKSKDNGDFKETIDWIETALKRVQREIDNLDQKASNVYKSWSSRNENLTKQINEVGNEISLQQKAANKYLSAANAVGLSSDYKKKVQNGAIDISTITDEALAEKIKSYQDYYESYLDCIDAVEELKKAEADLYAQRFENVQAQYDSVLQGYEHTEAMLDEYISQAEEQGYIVSKKYYDALINNEKQNINTLKKEQSDLIAQRDKAVADGKITKYSEEWYDMCAEVDSVTQAIEEGTTKLIEYNNAIRDLDFEKFELIQERISDVTSEADFLIELMSNKDLFDDKGRLTEQGAATMGLHALNYNTSMYQADDYGAKVAEIDRKIASGKLDPYDKEVINKRKEYAELQRDAILNAENEKNAIKDLVEEGINLELDALQERIDLHNEELDSMRNLYDYQKNVEEQTKNIASLRKQLGAYEGFDDEETRAKVQELKVSLEEAKTDLQETEWDRYIDQQSQLLDTLYTEYETILNSRFDNIDFLLQGVIDGINAAAGEEGAIATALGSGGAIATAIVSAMGENGTIKTILNTEANNVGTTLSTAMNNIWSVGEGNAKSVLTKYGDGFQNQQTTTNATLNGIKTDVNAMVDDIDKDAQKKVTANKTTTSAKKNPTTNTSTTNKTNTTNTNKPTSSGDGKAKVGDKVKFVSGKYYYDSQGKKPLGSKYQGKQVYITKINTAKWATHPYHISTGAKLGSGDLGWLKLNQLSGYATGKKRMFNNEYAWTQENGQEYIVRPSDGAILTPIAKGDSVLSATASSNIWSMANNPAEFIKDNLKLDAANVPNGANVQSNYTQHFDKVIFNMPNVKNYNELVSEMQRDPKFEKLIHAMTVDQIAGKSKLAKNKVIR